MNSSQTKIAIGAAALVAVAVAAWLAFGFFGIQSLVLDDEVDESGPVFASGAAAEDGEDGDGTGEVDSEEFDAAMAEAAENPSEAADEEPMPGEVVTLASGTFAGTSRYTITGEAQVLNDGSEQRFLRFEDFESTNGPDLNVYLRADDGDYIDLGDLKGNIGSQNYEIPADVDLEVYDTVQIWCVRFGVEFGNATLA